MKIKDLMDVKNTCKVRIYPGDWHNTEPIYEGFLKEIDNKYLNYEINYLTTQIERGKLVNQIAAILIIEISRDNSKDKQDFEFTFEITGKTIIKATGSSVEEAEEIARNEIDLNECKISHIRLESIRYF